MEALKHKILTEGISIGESIIKVDGFLNHQIDVKFMDQVGKEFAERFKGVKIDKILTIEASGIAVAMAAARYLDYVPVVFAKKVAPNTMVEGFYEAEARSFTKGSVSLVKVAKKFLKEGENILVLDDFLAHGEAAFAMTEVIRQAGGSVVGIGAVIEKKFQGGSEKLRKAGYKVESLAIIKTMNDGVINFE